MKFDSYYDAVENSCSCGCDNDRDFDRDNERCQESEHNEHCEDCRKEYLGKSVSECKYFRVCCKKFVKPERKERSCCCCCRCQCNCCK